MTSDKMMKTIVVRVDRLVKHPVYKRYVRKRSKFMAHNEIEGFQPATRFGLSKPDPSRRTNGGASSRCCERRVNEIIGLIRLIG